MTFFGPFDKGFKCYNSEYYTITFDELIFELDMTHNSKYVFLDRYVNKDIINFNNKNEYDEDNLGYIAIGRQRIYVYYYTTFINELKFLQTIPNRISHAKISDEIIYKYVYMAENYNSSHSESFIYFYNIIGWLIDCFGKKEIFEYHIKPKYEKEIVSYIETQLNEILSNKK